MNQPSVPGHRADASALPEARRERARALLAALPASVQMPAGTGKTQLLVDLVAEASTLQPPRATTVLVLTHTHAGVQAIRRRLGPEIAQTAHVATLSSFAFEFARAYPHLGGVDIPAHPDWEQSPLYLQAAVRVCANRHVQHVLRASFNHVLVDEYQDCSQGQHDLVELLQRAVPATAIFGDPLQAIFGFNPETPLASWAQVQQCFPNHAVECAPWRWAGHNPELGEWLLDLRTQMIPGVRIDLSNAATPPGVQFLAPGTQTLSNVIYQPRPPVETVLVISGPAPAQTRAIAGRFGKQGYTAMEDVNGTFMRHHLSALAALPAADRPRWTAELAKACFTGLGKLDTTVTGRLGRAQLVSTLKRPGLEQTLAALDTITANPTLSVVATAMLAIDRAGEASPHSGEAWRDTATAIRTVAATDPPPTNPDALREELLRALSAARDRLRHVGRVEHRRQVSRTVLVKGLEYDHVVIANLAEITDACNLYVALSRPRKSLTIIGPSPHLTVTATRGVHT